MTIHSNTWIRIALFNLMLVALLGTLMRYKIGFSFPYFNQKYIQEAHSHFAFTGWITHSLFFLVIAMLRQHLVVIKEGFYRFILMANLVSAYGMLIAFFIQGYAAVSITFSVFSLITGYIFSFMALKDLKKMGPGHPGKNWIIAAIWFGIFSTIGTAYLAYMMATFRYNQEAYLGSVYFYLHFQYNGWFFFAIMGIFMNRIRDFADVQPLNRRIFLFFVLSGIPTFFLSTLWAKLPTWLYALVVVSSICQMIGWGYLVLLVRRNLLNFRRSFPKAVQILLGVAGVALTIKLFLQAASTVPEISKLAFGFRPIVIAYLHLILLLVITVFLLAIFYDHQLIRRNRLAKSSMLSFMAAAGLNELVLAVQGIASFSYTVIPFVNEVLFIIAFSLFITSLLLLFSQWRSDANQQTL